MKKFLISLVSITVPVITAAQGYLTNTTGISRDFLSLLNNTLVPIVFSLALLFFFWGVALYLRQSEHDKERGKKVMAWGVVALFVMSSVWGLVFFFRREFNIQDRNDIMVPTVQIQNN